LAPPQCRSPGSDRLCGEITSHDGPEAITVGAWTWMDLARMRHREPHKSGLGAMEWRHQVVNRAERGLRQLEAVGRPFDEPGRPVRRFEVRDTRALRGCRRDSRPAQDRLIELRIWLTGAEIDAAWRSLHTADELATLVEPDGTILAQGRGSCRSRGARGGARTPPPPRRAGRRSRGEARPDRRPSRRGAGPASASSTANRSWTASRPNGRENGWRWCACSSPSHVSMLRPTSR
jgi:hypothetical protein